MYLTLGAAARQYSIPKSTLSRALRDGKLSGQRCAETGSYRIEISELERWRDAVAVVRATAETVAVAQPAPPVPSALERVAALEAEIAGLRELVRVHSEASEQWREQAQRLALADQRARAAASVPAVPQRARSWWPFRRAG
jgi:hypothetical protein